MRIRTRLAGLFLIALASVALAACGGGSSGGDAKSLLSDGFSKPIPKATIALNVSATLQGVPGLTQPVSLKLNGPYESRGKNKVPKFDFDVAISGGGQSFTGKLISTGDNAFVGLSGQNYEVGQQAFAAFEQQLASKTTQANGKTLKQLGIDPQSWITNPKTQGDEDVAGTKTTKVTGTFNAEKFIRDLNSVAGKASGAVGTAAPQKLTEAQIKQFSQAVKDPKFEIFVAKGDKTIRKITASLQFAVPAAQRTQTQGVSGGSVQFSIQFSNVGQPAQVTAPTGAKPLQNLIDQIKSLTTGSTGSSGSSGSGSGSGSNSGSGSSGSGSGGASTAQYQKYAACVSKAGSDQTAAAKCLDLLK